MSRRAALAGATGLVGGALLGRLLEDPELSLVVASTRRPLPAHPKLHNPPLEGDWELPSVDEAYCALGTTRRDAGSAAAFRAVDLELVATFARAARAAGARRFGLVSALGADASSLFLYPRTKGEAESACAALGFERLVIARPSLLLGERRESRPAERAAIAVSRALAPILPARWRAVSAERVAAALLAASRDAAPGLVVLESEALR